MSNKRVLVGLLTGIMVCSLTACGGGYYKNASTGKNDFSFEANLSTEENDKASEELNADADSVVDASHVNTGVVQMSQDGTVFSWNQYGYDENGKLTWEKLYYTEYPGYTETTYNEAGLVISIISYSEEGGEGYGSLYEYDEQGNVLSYKDANPEWTDMNIDYSYEKDESGRVTRQYAKHAAEAEPFQYTDYFYDEAGKLERMDFYNIYSDWQLCTQQRYDSTGNMVAEETFTGGERDGYYYYEYDTNGDLISERYANMIQSEEVVYNYIYSYDNAGNLIFVNTYDDKGNLLNRTLNAYAEAAEYSCEELTAQAKETESRFYEATPKEEDHFELVKEKILDDETIFTFGYYSAQFMQVESIELVEFGWNERGRFCSVGVNYSSDYGKYYLGGEVYYVIDGAGNLQLTECKLNTWGDSDIYRQIVENQPPQEYLYVHYNSYFPTMTTTNSIEPDKSAYYQFAGLPEEFVGTVKVKSIQSPETPLRMGEFTAEACMEENVEEGVNFILKMCWENGLVEKHYCVSIYDQYTFLILGYDEETWEPISKKLYLIEGAPSYVRELLMKRAEWEWEGWENAYE